MDSISIDGCNSFVIPFSGYIISQLTDFNYLFDAGTNVSALLVEASPEGSQLGTNTSALLAEASREGSQMLSMATLTMLCLTYPYVRAATSLMLRALMSLEEEIWGEPDALMSIIPDFDVHQQANVIIFVL